MKKVMISQPMKDKTEEEIIKERDNAKKYLESKGYEVVNTFFEEDWNKEIGNNIIHKPLFFLGKSIAWMSQCDAIYFANGCNGVFNGYISWARNVGRCFSNDYDITFLYDNLPDVTYNNFSTFFNCVKRETSVNYTCDRFFVVYTEYYYPKNIFTLDENYLFIHGNMSDYPNSRRFYDDIYTKYIAVSKVAAERAVGYFPTDKIEHILNPCGVTF